MIVVSRWLIDFEYVGNQVGVVGAQALAEMLKVNGSITTLNLSGMHILDCLFRVAD